MLLDEISVCLQGMVDMKLCYIIFLFILLLFPLLFLFFFAFVFLAG